MSFPKSPRGKDPASGRFSKGDFHHPNTMTAKLLAGSESLYELEYYSVGGGFIEWKGYQPPDKGQPTCPFSYARDLKPYLIDDKFPLAKLLLENEMAISGMTACEMNSKYKETSEGGLAVSLVLC